MSSWQDLVASRVLTAIDIHFGKLLHRRSPRGLADLVATAGALVSSERGRGHSCVKITDAAGGPFPADARIAVPMLPALEDWQPALEKSKLVEEPGSRREPWFPPHRYS